MPSSFVEGSTARVGLILPHDPTDIGSLIRHPALAINPNANVHSCVELSALDLSIEIIYVDSHACNDEACRLLDLSPFTHLKAFEVGEASLRYVDVVKLIGLKVLERVVIGQYCFIGYSEKGEKGHFHLRDCERLRELKIGRKSFWHYSVCEMSNLDALEGIEIGDEKNSNDNFYYVSQLELRSRCVRVE